MAMATNCVTTENPLSVGDPQLDELIGGLPEDLGLECLTRLSHTAHGAASRVCRRWRHLLQSREFYYHRQRSGLTRKVACLVQALPTQVSPDGRKPGGGSPAFGITVFDPAGGTWDRVDPCPYPNGLPVFCQLAGCEGKLVVMGGWDPVSYDPVRDVFAYDFAARRWERRSPMPEKRSFFAAAGDPGEGRVYVAGGHGEGKAALRSAWAYDVRADAWTELAGMSRARDECEGAVVGREFWVVSGYGTESQGGFEGSAECYRLDTGEWRRAESAWGRSQCPRSCVRVGEDGGLTSWTEADAGVRVGTCGVALGPSALVCGAPYQGVPHGFYITKPGEGQTGKYEKMTVPEQFSGLVQSGCCVEI